MSYMELEGLDLTLAPMPSGFSFLGALITARSRARLSCHLSVSAAEFQEGVRTPTFIICMYTGQEGIVVYKCSAFNQAVKSQPFMMFDSSEDTAFWFRRGHGIHGLKRLSLTFLRAWTPVSDAIPEPATLCWVSRISLSTKKLVWNRGATS